MNILRLIFKTLCVSLITIIIYTSCGCCRNYMSNSIYMDGLLASKSDTIKLNFPMKDSLSKIMRHPRKITCVLGCANYIDSLRSDTTKDLPKEMYSIFNFLFWSPTNFESNNIVYGTFSTSVNYIIKGRNDQQLTIQFDFGLKKWRLLDKDSRIVLTADLKNENLQLLRLTRLLFPNDTTLQLMNENLTSFLK